MSWITEHISMKLALWMYWLLCKWGRVATFPVSLWAYDPYLAEIRRLKTDVKVSMNLISGLMHLVKIHCFAIRTN